MSTHRFEMLERRTHLDGAQFAADLVESQTWACENIQLIGDTVVVTGLKEGVQVELTNTPVKLTQAEDGVVVQTPVDAADADAYMVQVMSGDICLGGFTSETPASTIQATGTAEASDPAEEPAPVSGEEAAYLDYPEMLARGLDHQKFVTMGHISLAELDRQSSGEGDVSTLAATGNPATSTVLDIPDMLSAGLSAQKYVTMGDIALAELDQLSSDGSVDAILK